MRANPDNQTDTDQSFMAQAMRLAHQAQDIGEVPVGALVVFEGKVIGQGYNQTISAHDPCAHAEIMAMREAASAIGNYRLTGCDLYVTLEPCTMCVGALIHARIERLIYGATEPKAGAVASQLELLSLPHYNHVVQVESGVMADESSAMLSHFFKQRRLFHKAKKAAETESLIHNDPTIDAVL
jgi:tRNA(adenine34) deaminase